MVDGAVRVVVPHPDFRLFLAPRRPGPTPWTRVDRRTGPGGFELLLTDAVVAISRPGFENHRIRLGAEARGGGGICVPRGFEANRRRRGGRRWGPGTVDPANGVISRAMRNRGVELCLPPTPHITAGHRPQESGCR